ncbi:hypothetical protein FA15DRAFT_709370 [Coprinopsis marcescibilis]|uniref:Uncharacterized protein n=1 Tax=Coprinopsis marcescibilis TaxID=230819 RepID=A0A5C3KGP1_COPMA|nr:hypothetical protein FA15DRAFT_709370 [Coprinopsis marcescibilis]
MAPFVVPILSEQAPNLEHLHLSFPITQASAAAIANTTRLRTVYVGCGAQLGFNLFLFCQQFATLPDLEGVTISSQNRALGSYVPPDEIFDDEHMQEHNEVFFNGTPEELDTFFQIHGLLLKPLTHIRELGPLPPSPTNGTGADSFPVLKRFSYGGTVVELTHLLEVPLRDTIELLELSVLFPSFPGQDNDDPRHWTQPFGAIRRKGSNLKLDSRHLHREQIRSSQRLNLDSDHYSPCSHFPA